ncbi:exopolysaccharide transport protein family [Brucella sp. BO2]|uniref:tyrosine-protein kinase family protein n=1 Tax=Brucella sp. BO2 TaxID=693750 RepID=UPI0001E446D8|nr:tyrosine-protein kinase family protein [Brucella sp. BO2]EFM59318.1 exopolysaccharide transport protein family [Brucella sp. BO2]QPN27783.1 tyrosine-protein kinase family protein [Brucella sp. BO2]
MPHNPNGVLMIANRLIDVGERRVIVVSPEGDPASAGSVKLLRELADRGKRVIFIDMTAFGTVSAAMLDGNQPAGITDLLAGKRRFKEVIHCGFSQAHVIPLGNADPVLAMRSADRLPLILDALETIYDFVLIECGPSSSVHIRQVTDGAATIIMSIVDPDDNAVAISALDLDQNGFEDVIILMGEAENI